MINLLLRCLLCVGGAGGGPCFMCVFLRCGLKNDCLLLFNLCVVGFLSMCVFLSLVVSSFFIKSTLKL